MAADTATVQHLGPENRLPFAAMKMILNDQRWDFADWQLPGNQPRIADISDRTKDVVNVAHKEGGIAPLGRLSESWFPFIVERAALVTMAREITSHSADLPNECFWLGLARALCLLGFDTFSRSWPRS